MAVRAQSELDVTSCPVCEGSRLVLFAALNTPYGERQEGYEIYVCERCGHGYANGRIDSAYLTEIYSDGFHQTSQQQTSDLSLPIYVNARARVAWLRSQGLSGRLLDVGCGNGAFVEAASQGFVASGIELSSAAAEAARERGLDVRAGDFIGMEFGGTKFDVITFWDVLAGFPDLDAVLGKCVSLMKPMSVLVGSVPLIGGVTAKTLRSRWPLLIPPVNIHYFDRRSIQMLAAKHGLNVIDVRSMAKKVACDFVIWKALRSLRMFHLADKAAKFTPSWPISVNTGDIAYFLLQRPVEEK